MTSPMNCDTARDLFFELRQGRIEAAQQEAFEAHVAQCSTCRDYADKLDSMLDEALLWQPAQEISDDRDSLFDNIVAEIERPAQPQRSSETERLPERNTDDPGPGRTGGLPYLIGLAAAVAATAAITLFSVQLLDSPNLSEEPSLAESGGDEAQAVDEVPQMLYGPYEDHGQAAEGIRLSEALRVIPEDDARWSLDADGNIWELTARQGTVVVEFLPRHEEESLRVRLPGVTGVVTGTVLYVDAEKTEIGLVTGGVSVSPDGGEPVPLQPRQSWREGQIEDIDDVRWEELHKAVDLEAHERRRQQLQRQHELVAEAELSQSPDEERPAADDGAQRDSPEAVASALIDENPSSRDDSNSRGPVNLRMKAEKAMRDRQFDQAAQHYEELLEMLPARDRAAGTIRLDLARLYQYELNNRQRTVHHLEIFADTWPDDALTPRVISQLCRLVDEPDDLSRCRRRE